MSQDKRLKVDVWVSGGLREAIGFAVGSDKPASDATVRNHFQDLVDKHAVKIADSYIQHGKPLAKKKQKKNW
jgi:hypothetical protein